MKLDSLKTFTNKDCLKIIDLQIEELLKTKEYLTNLKSKFPDENLFYKSQENYIGGEEVLLTVDLEEKVFHLNYLYQTIIIPFKSLKYVVKSFSGNSLLLNNIIKTIKQENEN